MTFDPSNDEHESVVARTVAPKEYEFRAVEKFCKKCGAVLKLKSTLHIKRKRYCSKECMRGPRTEEIVPPDVLNHNRKNDPPSVDRVRELLDYDPITGKMTWRVDRGVGVGRGGRRCKGREAGSISSRYWRIRIDGVLYDRSLLAWVHYHGAVPLGMVDHDDLNKSNDAISNLREASRSHNSANSTCRKNNKCGFKGVTFNRKTSRWQAGITVRGKYFYLGRFDTPERASAAYAIAAVEKFKEFARTL